MSRFIQIERRMTLFLKNLHRRICYNTVEKYRQQVLKGRRYDTCDIYPCVDFYNCGRLFPDDHADASDNRNRVVLCSAVFVLAVSETGQENVDDPHRNDRRPDCGACSDAAFHFAERPGDGRHYTSYNQRNMRMAEA